MLRVDIVLQQEGVEAPPQVLARDESGGAALDSTLTLILNELRRQS
jgi:hypothetical protein